MGKSKKKLPISYRPVPADKLPGFIDLVCLYLIKYEYIITHRDTDKISFDNNYNRHLIILALIKSII